MIKIVAKNGKYKQHIKGNIIEIMDELANIIKHMMVPNPSRRDQVQEKSIAFAAMVGIAEYFNKSEMLELLHDACEDVTDKHKEVD
jgi:hypothetical protein